MSDTGVLLTNNAGITRENVYTQIEFKFDKDDCCFVFGFGIIRLWFNQRTKLDHTLFGN